MPEQKLSEKQSAFRRDAVKVLVVGVVVIAGVYVFDLVSGRIESPTSRAASPSPTGAVDPAPSGDPAAQAPSGAGLPANLPPDLAKALGASGASGGTKLPPDLMKALGASGASGLPPELAKALGASGPSGAGPALPPRAADTPSYWPPDIPTPPGAKLQTQISLDTKASLMYQSPQAPQQTVDHYLAEMPKLGWKQTDKLTAQDGTRVTYTKDARTATVTVGKPREGASLVVLSVEVKEPPPGAPPAPGAPAAPPAPGAPGAPGAGAPVSAPPPPAPPAPRRP